MKWERWESNSSQFLIEPEVLSVLLGSFLLQSHLQLKSLESMVEKLKADLQSTDQVRFFGERRSLHRCQRGARCAWVESGPIS